jgi:hypothetical protein
LSANEFVAAVSRENRDMRIIVNLPIGEHLYPLGS